MLKRAREKMAHLYLLVGVGGGEEAVHEGSARHLGEEEEVVRRKWWEEGEGGGGGGGHTAGWLGGMLGGRTA